MCYTTLRDRPVLDELLYMRSFRPGGFANGTTLLLTHAAQFPLLTEVCDAKYAKKECVTNASRFEELVGKTLNFSVASGRVAVGIERGAGLVSEQATVELGSVRPPRNWEAS